MSSSFYEKIREYGQKKNQQELELVIGTADEDFVSEIKLNMYIDFTNNVYCFSLLTLLKRR